MYKNKFAAALKIGNEVLLEDKTTQEISLPYGSEYSIFLKNLSDHLASVDIFIDGKKEYTNIKINSKDSLDLNAFKSGNAFKFVEKSEELNKLRPERIEDSLIEIVITYFKKSAFDKLSRLNKTMFEETIRYDPPRNPLNPFEITSDSLDKRNLFEPISKGGGFTGSGSSSLDIMYACCTNHVEESSLKRDFGGITVPGKPTKNNYSEISSYDRTYLIKEDSFSIVMKLNGLVDKEVKTSKSKKKCPTCNKKYKAAFNYCPLDGSYLS